MNDFVNADSNASRESSAWSCLEAFTGTAFRLCDFSPLPDGRWRYVGDAFLTEQRQFSRCPLRDGQKMRAPGHD